MNNETSDSPFDLIQDLTDLENSMNESERMYDYYGGYCSEDIYMYDNSRSLEKKIKIEQLRREIN